MIACADSLHVNEYHEYHEYHEYLIQSPLFYQ